MSLHHTEENTIRQSVSYGKTKRIRSLSPLSTISSTSDEYTGKFLIYKERGETLAMLLRRFRKEQGMPNTVPITYAGRLDPMAEGVVLLLAGEERYAKDALLGLQKTYEIEVLLGIATDSQDVLGIITRESYGPINTKLIEQVIVQMQKITELPYPQYSSVLVEGKPLFVHARAGNQVSIPTKKITITESKLLRVRIVPVELVAREAIDDIGLVEGDFRQLSVMKQWKALTETHREKEVVLVTLRVTASSGTYMRSLAQWLGEQLGVPALAYKIKRTKLGDWSL